MPIVNLKPLIKRFLEKVTPEPNSGCWLWTAGLSGGGYGQMTLGKKSEGKDFAHRIAYRLFKGQIPEGMQIDHLCRVRCCVNPDHLEAVTQRENIRRGDAGKHHHERTRCKYGHQLIGDNIVRSSDGGRRCAQCGRNRAHLHYKRKLRPPSPFQQTADGVIIHHSESD